MNTARQSTSTDLLKSVDKIIKQNTDRNDKLKQICEMLHNEVDLFDWVGFYLVDPDADRELVLGPYVGEETDHTRIPFGKGICGQAADTLETYVIQDVSQEDNYLACSVDVKAEIVVPIMKGDQLIGELDIDSHTKDSLTEEHRKLLEAICKKVAALY